MPLCVHYNYRPSLEEFKALDINDFKKVVVRRCVEKYYISAEKGKNSDCYTHYHIYAVINCDREDNWARAIKKSLNIQKGKNHMFKGRSIVVNSEEDRWYLGYVQKEGGPYLTNVDSKELSLGLSMYRLDENRYKRFVEQAKSVSHRLDLNELFELVLKTHIEEKRNEYYDVITKNILATHNVPFSVYCKVNHRRLAELVGLKIADERRRDSLVTFVYN